MAYIAVFFIHTIFSVFLHCFQWLFIGFTVYFSIIKMIINSFFFHSAYLCTKYGTLSDRCHYPKLFITIQCTFIRFNTTRIRRLCIHYRIYYNIIINRLVYNNISLVVGKHPLSIALHFCLCTIL